MSLTFNGFKNSPITLTFLLVPFSSISPLEILWFSKAIAFSTSLKLILDACILYKSNATSSSFSWTPLISTPEISTNSSILSSRYSAYSLSLSIEKSPERLIFIMGICSLKFTSVTLGSLGRSLGKSLSAIAISTLSFTFINASEGEISKLNSTLMLEYPCIEVEVILSIPVIAFISFSSLFVINFSTSVAEFPGYGVAT